MINYHYLSGCVAPFKVPLRIFMEIQYTFHHGNTIYLSSWKYNITFIMEIQQTIHSSWKFNRPFIMVNYQLLVAKIGANSFDIQFPSNYKIQWNLHKPTPVGHENIVGLCNAIYITLAATLVSVAWLSFQSELHLRSLSLQNLAKLYQISS